MSINTQRSLLEQTKAGGPTQSLRVKPEVMSKLAQGGIDNVLEAIQTAIELEHSTIPPYLYALYSLDDTKNGDVVGIIQSVVVEEMLHMTLACNIMNALGGTPNINTPSFIPTYPGTLPGIESPQGWQVDLQPCSKEVIQSTFMQIEMPVERQDFPVEPSAVLGAEEEDDSSRTIGAFYLQLQAQIANLDPGAFVSPPCNQVGPNVLPGTDIAPGAIVVYDFATVQQAIGIITDQGEGTDLDPFDEEGNVAHYYRFAEIVNGQKLVKSGNPPTYAYSGASVNFDPSGVWNVQPDRSGNNPAVLNFNYTYTTLLNTLHDLFNGKNTKDQLNSAVKIMFSLRSQAMSMMSSDQGVGPSFEYQPTNPGVSSGN